MQENITGLIEPITTIPNSFLTRTDQGKDVAAKFLMMEKGFSVSDYYERFYETFLSDS